VRFGLFGPLGSNCQKIKMMQCTLFTAPYENKRFQHGAFLLSILALHLTELSNVFQAGCFNFAQMKASVEPCINKLYDAAAISILKANCEKFDSELGELRTPDVLSSPCATRETGVNESTTRASLCLASQDECMPRR